MARTICDCRAIPPRLPFASAGSVSPSRPASGPTNSTSIPSRSQEVEASLSSLPTPLRIAVLATVDTALELHPAGGATVSLVLGNMVGQDRFAVGAYPERTVELTTPPMWESLVAFVFLNLDLLLRRNHALGTWFNKANGRHVLDVVVCLRTERTALELAAAYSQVSIFHLANCREIRLAGPPRYESFTPAELLRALETEGQ